MRRDSIIKKIKSLMLMFIMVLSIVGCSSNVSELETPIDSKAEVNTSVDKKSEDKKTLDNSKNIDNKTGEKLEVHYIDVGQGDATLIKLGDKNMVIDGGDNKTSSKFVSYLKKENIKKIDYMVATHPHADHISGLVGALNVFPVENILLGTDKMDSKVYKSMINLIKEKKINEINPNVGYSFDLGNAKCTVVGPTAYNFDTNNNSIAIRIDYGEKSFLFTGDAEINSESAMMYTGENLKADVFQAGHHGSRTSNSSEFLKEVSPEYVVISCGKNNKYGHPNFETMDTFKKMNIKVYRTDEQGDIIATSNGKNIEFSTKESENLSPGIQVVEDKKTEKQAESSNKKESPKSSYVLNKKSKVYHLPNCSTLEKMSAENREDVEDSKENIEKKSYRPCGRCKP